MWRWRRKLAVNDRKGSGLGKLRLLETGMDCAVDCRAVFVSTDGSLQTKYHERLDGSDHAIRGCWGRIDLNRVEQKEPVAGMFDLEQRNVTSKVFSCGKWTTKSEKKWVGLCTECSRCKCCQNGYGEHPLSS